MLLSSFKKKNFPVSFLFSIVLVKKRRRMTLTKPRATLAVENPVPQQQGVIRYAESGLHRN